MMRKCPKCGNFTIAYDTYREVLRCMADECGCTIIDENAYSYFKYNRDRKTMDKIRTDKDGNNEVIKSYSMI